MPLDKEQIRQVAEAWTKLHHLPHNKTAEREMVYWAYERLCDLVQNDPEEGWKVIQAIRRLDGSDVILSNLGAGPVEDLMVAHGPRFIERVEALAGQDQQFRKMLGCTWQNRMPDELWARIKAVAVPSW